MMENNDIDIIENESKFNHSLESISILDEEISKNRIKEIMGKIKEDIEEKEDKEDKEDKEEESEDYKLYMNICKKLFDSIIKNKKTKPEKKIDDVNCAPAFPNYTEIHENMKKYILQTDRNDSDENNKKNDDDFSKSLKDITKTFLPSKAPIENFAPYNENFGLNATKKKQISKDNFYTYDSNFDFNKQKQFTTSSYDNYMENLDNFGDPISIKKPVEFIRPYIDQESETESALPLFREQKKQLFDDFSSNKQQMKNDKESIMEMDTEIDEQKVHMANMLKHLGGLITSMSHLMIK
jgi:hypothetical protein